MFDPVLTRHGTKRLRERIGIPKKAAQREIERALQFGIRRHDVSGRLRRYMDALFYRTKDYGKDPLIVVHGQNVYIFSYRNGDRHLITTFPLPPEYRGHKALKRKRETAVKETVNEGE